MKLIPVANERKMFRDAESGGIIVDDEETRLALRAKRQREKQLGNLGEELNNIKSRLTILEEGIGHLIELFENVNNKPH